MLRRDFASAATGAILVAGCSIFDDRQARIGWIGFENHRDEELTVEATIKDGSDHIFSEEYYVGMYPETPNVVEDDPVTEEGDYVVHVAVGDEQHEVEVMEHLEEDHSCIGILFVFLDYRQFDYSVRSMQEC